MKKIYPVRALLAGFVVFAVLHVLPVSAAYLTTYGSALAPSDPNSDTTQVGLYTEITDVYYAMDATYHYFRADLAADPTDPFNSWSYLMWVDSDNNTATGSDETGAENSPYLDDSLDGIDHTFALHYNLGTQTADHWHPYQVAAPYVGTTDFTDAGGIFQTSENGGTTLEWGVPQAWLGTGPMKWYAGVHEQTLDTTADMTTGYQLNDGPVVPEPSSLLLLGVVTGVGYTLNRRKRRGTSERQIPLS